MKTSDLYVITGGPCCGKTTLCKHLLEEGKIVLPEVARVILKRNKDGHGPMPDTDFDGFEREVFALQSKRENIASKFGEPVFLDRGLGDVAGYYESNDMQVPRELLAQMKQTNYAGVLLLDPLPYRKDEQRYETAKQAKKIHEKIHTAYTLLGYNVIPVPVFATPEDRVDFILNSTSLL